VAQTPDYSVEGGTVTSAYLTQAAANYVPVYPRRLKNV
jgi:hypothetical protein